MAKVELANVTVLDNPTAFLNPFQFEITFECLEDLAQGEKCLRTLCHSNERAPWSFVSVFLLDLEWQIVYVGSASSEAYDQTLDSVLVGPVPAGRHRFVFQVGRGREGGREGGGGREGRERERERKRGRERVVFTQADSPNPEKLPPDDVVGVTVVLLTCSFQSNEFVRVGYYVNNEYTDPELAENPPAKPIFEKVWLYCMCLVILSNIPPHTHTHTHTHTHYTHVHYTHTHTHTHTHSLTHTHCSCREISWHVIQE